jgi:hypothetical protein
MEGKPSVPETYEGVISLRWRLRPGAGRHTMPLLGSLVVITDTAAGADIATATDVQIHAPVHGVVTADLTLLTGADGRPIGNDGKVTLDGDGQPRTGVFRYMVAEVQTSRPTAQ